MLAEREPEWLERLTTDPASFAALEREVHEQARRQADLYVAGLLAKAGESPEMTQHVDRVRTAAEVPHRYFTPFVGSCRLKELSHDLARQPDGQQIIHKRFLSTQL